MTLPSVNFTDVNALTAMRSFLLGILPAPVEVIRGQDNRVAEPATPDFVVMTSTLQKRLAFNFVTYADCAFNASISIAGVLSVTEMLHGTITLGNQLLAVGVGGVLQPGAIFVAGTITGTGGVGDYQLSGTIGAVSGTKMATGVFLALQPIEITIQLDVHGPNSTNNAQIISTLFRDQYAVDVFSAFGTTPPGWGPIPIGGTLPIPYNAIAPLYADEPRQSAFINAESQYEERWIVDACLQTNQVVTVARDFADTLKITLQDIE